MFKNTLQHFKNEAKKRPITIFFLLLGLLLASMIAGDIVRAPKEAEKGPENKVKSVSVYNAGSAPRMYMAAQIDKRHIISITAQVSGIVSYVHVLDGQEITTGQTIITLADTYNGQRISDVDTKIASVTQEKTNVISEKEISIVEDERDDLAKIDSNTITRKQLTIQKRNAELTSEVATLQKQKATVASALYTPSTPSKSTVERVHVSPGQYVTPGTVLATLRLSNTDTILEMLVPLTIASILDVRTPSILTIGAETRELFPIALSEEAVRGQQYSALYMLDAKDAPYFADKSFVSIDIPLERVNGKKFLIPIDAVSVARDAQYVFIAEEGFARSKRVTTGNVYGGYVEISHGITPNDQIILNRNILDGDRIDIIQ